MYSWALLLFIIVSAGSSPLKTESLDNVVDDKSFVNNSVEHENNIEQNQLQEDHINEPVENVPEHPKEPSKFESDTHIVNDPSHSDSELHNEEHEETNEVHPEEAEESGKQPIIYILEYIMPPYKIPAFPSLPSLPPYFPNFSWLSKLNFPNHFPNIFSNNASEVIVVEA